MSKNKIPPAECKSIHFSKVPHEIYGTVDLASIGIYAALAKFADFKTQETFVSIETLAEFTKSNAKTIKRGLRVLKDAGWIQRKKRGQGKSAVTVLVMAQKADRLEGPLSGPVSEPVIRAQRDDGGSSRDFSRVIVPLPEGAIPRKIPPAWQRPHPKRGTSAKSG